MKYYYQRELHFKMSNTITFTDEERIYLQNVLVQFEPNLLQKDKHKRVLNKLIKSKKYEVAQSKK